MKPKPSSILLSQAGSDRATAYITSNKIVRHGGTLYVTWLDAPVEPGQRSPVRLAKCDDVTGRPEALLTLGKGYDNHCGAAIALDQGGRFHAVLGAHHGPFLYRWSDDAADPCGWSEPIVLGPFDSYPSLVADRDGTLHLASRRMDERWELWYRRKPPGEPWSAPVSLAVGPLPGYHHFYQSISIGPSGNLHLLFQFCYTETGRSCDALGRMAVYLTSEDGGRSWYQEGKRAALPVTIRSAKPVLVFPGGGLKISNHVVDEHDRLWFHAALPGEGAGVLLRREGNGWSEVPLPASFRKLSVQGGRETGLSRDAAGTIHLVTATRPDNVVVDWHDPAFELFHVTLPREGAPRARQLTPTDPAHANWLPAIEAWDWARADLSGATAPALLYTRGTSCGPGGNLNAIRTDVHLIPSLS
ncbi:MAG TPA: sialidase family protein [Chthoniobacteraceae bacterium]|nr:sialidase family protein [Chthoniobacteraceae bacterium]